MKEKKEKRKKERKKKRKRKGEGGRVIGERSTAAGGARQPLPTPRWWAEAKEAARHLPGMPADYTLRPRLRPALSLAHGLTDA